MRRPILVLLGGLWAVPSLAADRLPAIDPPGIWRVMTWEEAMSSSKCVKNFYDAICTVETVMACWVRNRSDLCEAATGKEHAPVTAGSPYFSSKYRIAQALWVTEDRHAAERLGGAIYNWLRNDLRLDVMMRDCYKANCEEKAIGATSFFLRQVGGRWHVLEWADLSLPK